MNNLITDKLTRLQTAIRREIVTCLREQQQIRAAAKELGIGRQNLYNKIAAYGIQPIDWRLTKDEIREAIIIKFPVS